MSNLPIYIAISIGILVFGLKRLRISTKIIIYTAIAITGYIWSGFLKFGISIYNLDNATEEILYYWSFFILLTILLIVRDIYITPKNKRP
ncbi:hypothetical protein [Elizabethkingia anophelis]|uniref:hypothetical protein n=1 Tax=Elizabethkingia anophelis TaxID=1117645 RepID=UPI000A62A599|nr:hypothetical protein [Elizabethkingia anophelis]QGN21567.1 hypothetical protein GJV56_02535 [Elizabethkingia anophelis]QNV08229.1 hypothetical protein EIY88_02535 [Elizabethkingia anophelis]UTF89970.1 hypothetical protein J2N93_02540 [Elizabethkingia anophelis]UTG00841.1 hypothetical protein J2O04_02540 [Elizabethkingia anophelis]UTG04591.1 hypothetical protein J2O03_02545 [Elizabethkingia anophelis]